MDSETFWSAVAGTGLVAAIFGFWINNYFGPYLKKKAENLATQEDIQRLVDQVRETERVKAEISDRMWDRQAQWNAKRERYVAVVSDLSHLLTLQSGMRDFRKRRLETHAQDMLKLLNDMNEQGYKVVEATDVSRLFMSETTLQAYVAFTNAWGDLMNAVGRNLTDDFREESVALRSRLLEFIAAAKSDLGYQTQT